MGAFNFGVGTNRVTEMTIITELRDATESAALAAPTAPAGEGLIFDADELLVEEISIDGMCGVY